MREVRFESEQDSSMPNFGIITTFAGTRMPGYAGDSGPADKARLNNPYFCIFDRVGNLILADTDNNVVRRVDRKTKRISTIVGSGRLGYEGDGGPALMTAFNNLVAIAITEVGDIFLIDRLNSRVRKFVAKSGVVTSVVGDGTKAYGGDGGPGEKAQLKEPHDCVLNRKGDLLICDVADNRIRQLDTKTGHISTFAGTGIRRSEGNGGPVERASFAGSRAIAVHPRTGDIFICEREGNCIRCVEGKTGLVTHFAGTGQKGYSGDNGPAKDATFNGPKGLHCDPEGNLYIVDTENHAIRCVAARTGILTTVAGGRRGAEGDGGLAIEAGLNRPHGVTIGPDSALYIADSENHRIRRAEPIPSTP